MKRKTFSQDIDPQLADGLRRLSGKTGIKIYVLLETAIEDLLKKAKQNASK